ncbi:aminodeoxychorismate lyase [Paenibacillus sacheonensis]|uniref:aminodeoxychorismate lyase n=1 Tax=Paenibacillus sacheonensis TaxID=742054 RepID=A0A7X5C4L9_9BACL|nr:aminodeoxychorismate lyase [Paenibacillus sacheonensis]MBM7569288.1 4-amino-4-deoxychorismate lyase [Paenibacillus sacheonensis]NBC73500.1 aminodeoxychorismate lyase [Paenibacillus sacheonensis]
MSVGWNGSIKRQEEAVISVYDHGFLYGMGLFETFRTYGGQPYLLERHLRRLTEGCRSIGICYEPDEQHIRVWLRELMAANELTEAYVRLTITAGEGIVGLPSSEYEHPNALLLVKPLMAFDPKLYTDGRELVLLSTRRNTPEGEIRLKSLHYMNNILAKRELTAVEASQGAEGLMLTREGWLSEGIVSNLFWARAGKLFTPSIATGILPGVTRARVLELAAQEGIAVEEGFYPWDELTMADEAWVTNSVQELVPVTTLRNTEGRTYTVGGGQAGPMTSRLLALYRKDTGL